ncbi:MAG: hypothetical protein KF809_15035 [Chloroflexi bacterium]|nr:hypothetical protein [Chloroflexota bacterium]
MAAPTLTVLPGGLRQPELVTVERRAWDEARIELTVTRAERITFTTQVRHHVHLAAFALVKDRVRDAEYHLTQLERLAAREDARARAAIEDEPMAVRRAA